MFASPCVDGLNSFSSRAKLLTLGTFISLCRQCEQNTSCIVIFCGKRRTKTYHTSKYQTSSWIEVWKLPGPGCAMEDAHHCCRLRHTQTTTMAIVYLKHIASCIKYTSLTKTDVSINNALISSHKNFNTCRNVVLKLFRKSSDDNSYFLGGTSGSMMRSMSCMCTMISWYTMRRVTKATTDDFRFSDCLRKILGNTLRLLKLCWYSRWQVKNIFKFRHSPFST